MRLRNPPAAGVQLEIEIDDAEVAAPESGHDRGLAVERSALSVGAGHADKVLAGKQQMLVTEEEGVDAVEAGKVLPGILLARRGREPRKAGMAQRDDEIDAALKSADLSPRRLDDIDGRQASADMRLVPLRDLRRRDADHADLEPSRRPELVGEVAFDDDRRREPGRAVEFEDIAADDGKARLRIGALERLEAIVELMVAKRGDRVVEPVHGGDHRMDRARVPDDRGGGEVAKGRALENVAVVEQQAVGAFASRPGDQRGGAREADRVIRPITIIVVRIEIGVQVGQADEAQAQPGRGACERGFHVVLAAL